MKRFFILIIAVFISTTSGFNAVAEPSITENTSYYSISGMTEQEIRNSMNMNTPVLDNGKKFDAHTAWYISWNLLLGESNGSCAISKVITSVNIQFTYPRLENVDALPVPLADKWEEYYKALSDHEDGHKSIGVNAANDIENNIMNLPERTTCKELVDDANRLGDEIIKKYNALETEYDRKTDHGMNEGAVFP